LSSLQGRKAIGIGDLIGRADREGQVREIRKVGRPAVEMDAALLGVRARLAEGEHRMDRGPRQRDAEHRRAVDEPAISAVWFVPSTSAKTDGQLIQSVARASRPWIAA
jgi:hypothetical protein